MYETVLAGSSGPMGTIQLNRPQVLNAVNRQLFRELVDAVLAMDQDSSVRAILIHGDDQSFAAGADITEMADASAVEMLERETPSLWASLRRVTKPLIAGVSGYRLGGGCELALACDMIVASETAQFGLPVVRLGIMPGGGGTQRFVRAVGKAVAMEVIPAGRLLGAQEALAAGLINRVTPAGAWLSEARQTG